jgi:hypothetical protein
MRLLKVRLYYYIGVKSYLLGFKPACNYFLSKSEELDTEGKVWGKPLASPNKDEV